MNPSTLLRCEWGAVTFVLTVLIGMIVVPLALYFGNVKPAPVSLPTVASAARTASPQPTAAPTSVPAPSTTGTPTATPTAAPSPT